MCISACTFRHFQLGKLHFYTRMFQTNRTQTHCTGVWLSICVLLMFGNLPWPSQMTLSLLCNRAGLTGCPGRCSIPLQKEMCQIQGQGFILAYLMSGAMDRQMDLVVFCYSTKAKLFARF